MNETYIEKLQRLTKQAEEHNNNVRNCAVELKGCVDRIAELSEKIREIAERMVEQE